MQVQSLGTGLNGGATLGGKLPRRSRDRGMLLVGSTPIQGGLQEQLHFAILAIMSPSLRLVRDPLALAAALPDTPRWVETRWLLRSGEGVVSLGDAGDAGVVVGRLRPTAAVVGRPDPALLREVLADVPEDLELIVQLEALDGAREALPDWTVAFATIHSPIRPFRGGDHPQPGVVVSAPPEQRWLDQLPEEIRRHAARADDIAVSVEQGTVVAVCEAGVKTETLWDVGIDTLRGHRRRGHASACFRALAAHMADQGRQPVWGAEETNTASIRFGGEPRVRGRGPSGAYVALSPSA
jgi:hypothetical protein